MAKISSGSIISSQVGSRTMFWFFRAKNLLTKTAAPNFDLKKPYLSCFNRTLNFGSDSPIV